jgi:hypothetical protein
LLEHDVAHEFFIRVVAQARSPRLLSDEHFTVDGTLVETGLRSRASSAKDQGSTQPPDDPGNPILKFHGERRCNLTHQSSTDPEAKLAKNGPRKEARLYYSVNALMENRNGLLSPFGFGGR